MKISFLRRENRTAIETFPSFLLSEENGFRYARQMVPKRAKDSSSVAKRRDAAPPTPSIQFHEYSNLNLGKLKRTDYIRNAFPFAFPSFSRAPGTISAE